MIDRQKKGRPLLKRNWVLTLVGLLLLQFIFIVCDYYSWSPYKDFRNGTFFGSIINSKLFTEWFTPYKLPASNAYTAFFGITLLPAAFIGAIRDIFSRK